MASDHALPQRRISRRLTPAQYAQWRPLLEISRNLSTGVTGTRGVGKSTLLFLFAWLDAIVSDKPLVAILPISQVADLLFTHLALLHPAEQAAIWPKIRYVPLAGSEVRPHSPIDDWYVLPTGFYAPAGVGGEDAFVRSQRLPEIYLKIDPHLAEASVQGYPALWRAATEAGKILVACGLGVHLMADLLTHGHESWWQQRFDQAVRADPNVADAAAYFRTEYAQLTPGRRTERTQAVLTRLATFSSPLMQAQFGPAAWAVPWQEVMTRKLKVFIDLSHDHAEATRSFKMLFIFLSLVDFIKRYGAAHPGDRSSPLSVIIDEIAVMVGGKNSPMAADLDAFINTYSRNYNVHFVTSFQEPFQIEDPKILDTLLSLGTKFYARMTDPRSSRIIADRAIPFDPYAVKEVVYHRVGGIHGWDEPRNVYFSKPDQIELGRLRFDDLAVREFLVSRTITEGDKPLPLHPFSLNAFHLRPPDRAIAAEVKRRLVLRDGQRVGDVLAQLRRDRHDQRPTATDDAVDQLETDL